MPGPGHHHLLLDHKGGTSREGLRRCWEEALGAATQEGRTLGGSHRLPELVLLIRTVGSPLQIQLNRAGRLVSGCPGWMQDRAVARCLCYVLCRLVLL